MKVITLKLEEIHVHMIHQSSEFGKAIRHLLQGWSHIRAKDFQLLEVIPPELAINFCILNLSLVLLYPCMLTVFRSMMNIGPHFSSIIFEPIGKSDKFKQHIYIYIYILGSFGALFKSIMLK